MESDRKRERQRMEEVGREVTRRRFLAWTAGVAGTGAVAAAGGSMLGDLFGDEPSADRQAADSGPEFEQRALGFGLPPKVAAALSDLTIVTGIGEYPIMRHTKDTWLQLSDQNALANRLSPDGLGHFVGDPQDPGKPFKVPMPKERAVPTLLYGKLDGKEIIVGSIVVPPRQAMERQIRAALSNLKVPVQTLFKNDVRLAALMNQEGATPKSLLEAIDLSDLVTIYQGAMAGALFSHPTIRMAHGDAAAATLKLLYGCGAVGTAANAAHTFFTKMRAWFGAKEAMKAIAPDGRIVDQTVDPRVANPQFSSEAALPQIPAEIGSQTAYSFEFFVREGMTWQGREVDPDLIRNFRLALRNASAEALTRIADYPELIAKLGPKFTQEDLTGKSFFYAPETPVQARAVGNQSSSPRNAAAGEGGIVIRNAGDQTFEGVTFHVGDELVHKAGLSAELVSVTKEVENTVLTIRIRNYMQRAYTFGVQYFDHRGIAIDPPNESRLGDLKKEGASDPTWNPNASILEGIPVVAGIPLPGLNYLDVNVMMHSNATRTRLIAGTMGVESGWKDLFNAVVRDSSGNEVLDANGNPRVESVYTGSNYVRPNWYSDAVAATLVVNVGLPAAMLLADSLFAGAFMGKLSVSKKKMALAIETEPLALATGLPLNQMVISSVTKDAAAAKSAFKGDLITQGVMLALLGMGQQGVKASSDSWWSIGIGMGKMAVNLLGWIFFSKLLAPYLASIAAGSTAKLVPILGQAYMISAVAADTATVGQATVDITTCADTAYWDISGSYEVTIEAKPQAGQAGFSLSAAAYVVDVLYDGDAKPERWLPEGWSESKAPVPKPEDWDPNVPWDDTTMSIKIAKTKEFEQPRTDPIVVKGRVKFGGSIRYIFTIVDEDSNVVGKASSETLDNYDPARVVKDISLEVERLAVEVGQFSYYEREWTTEVSGGKLALATKPAKSVLKATVANAEITPGQVVMGDSTNLMSYVYEDAGKWFVRQFMLDADPNKGAAILKGSDGQPKSFIGRPPHLIVDRLAQAVDKGARNWLLEPMERGTGYHIRRLQMSKDEIGFNPKEVWGTIKGAINRFAQAPNGFLVGVNSETGKLAVLRPSTIPYKTGDVMVPEAKMLAGKGNLDGSRPGLMREPIGIAVASNNTVVALEQTPKRLQAFSTDGNPVTAFKDYLDGQNGESDTDYYQALDSGLTFLDMGTDGFGYIFTLGHEGGGTDPTQYFLDVYRPGTEKRLFRVRRVNSGRMAVGHYRDIVSLNYSSIAAPVTGGKQPDASIWIPRTPKIVRK